MRYFYKLASGLNVLPTMDALMRNPHLWNQDTCRTTFKGTPHAQVDDIILRFGRTGEDAADDLEAVDRPEVVGLLRQAKEMAINVMQLVRGSRLGRVVITKLAPGSKILPHKDTIGAYAQYYTRYHAILQGLPGSLYLCGDETVQMLTGDLWWFDASAEHSLINNSGDDRIHLLVDVRIDP